MSDISNYLNHITAERDRAWGEQRAVIERAVAEKRELSAEERATVERTDAAIDDYDKQGKEWRAKLDRENEAGKAREFVESALRPEDRSSAAKRDAGQEAEVRAFLAGERKHVDIDLVAAANEMAAYRSGMSRGDLRDLTVVTAAAGGTLVPTNLARSLYMAMETITGPRTAGATILTTSGGEPLALPKVSSFGTAAIVGEGTAFAEADAAFSLVTLNAWKYAQLVQVSVELTQDSAIDVLSFVANDTGRALGRVTNTAYSTGTGSNAPQGFITGSRAAGTGVVSQTGATGVPSYANLIDLVFSVSDEAYAGSQAKFMTKWSNIAAIRKILDTTGQPLWQPSLIAGQPSTLLGYEVVSNPAMAAWGTAASTYTMAFGDFSAAYVIRDVGSVRFERSDDFAFSSDLITFRAAIRTDGKTRDTGAVKIMAAPTT